MEAPPVARQGLPKKPCKNRSTSRPPILFTSAAGTQRITKSAMVTIYGGLRPTEGISLIGEKMSGPVPYAKTYNARPSAATSGPIPKMGSMKGSEDAKMAEPIYTASV